MDTPGTQGLIAVLEDAVSALRRPGNDFVFSGWEDETDACNEVASFIKQLHNRSSIDRSALKTLFAPTGPLQEVSLSSGWEDEFLLLSERFDAELDRALSA